MHRQPLHIEEAYQTSPNTQPITAEGAERSLLRRAEERPVVHYWYMFTVCLSSSTKKNKKKTTFTRMKAGTE